MGFISSVRPDLSLSFFRMAHLGRRGKEATPWGGAAGNSLSLTEHKKIGHPGFRASGRDADISPFKVGGEDGLWGPSMELTALPIGLSTTPCMCGCMLSRVGPFATMDCYPLGSSVHGIFQARILEWVAKPSSRGSS